MELSPSYLMFVDGEGCRKISMKAQLDTQIDTLLNGPRTRENLYVKRTEVWYDAALNCKVFACLWRVQMPINSNAMTLFNIRVKGPVVLVQLAQ